MSLLSPIDLSMINRGRAADDKRLGSLYEDLQQASLSAGSDRDEAMWEVSRGFEEMFLDILMRSMRQVKLGPDPLTDSSAGRMYQSMLDQELVHLIGENGGMGLSDKIYDYLSRSCDPQNTVASPLAMLEGYGRPPLRSMGTDSAADLDPFSGNGPLTAPVSGRVTSEFGMRSDPLDGTQRFHSGIDIACPTGTPIRAAGAGRVVFAGDRGGYGLCVVVDHGDGLSTLYAHQNRLLVDKGDPVAAGQAVGLSGSTGRSTGPHLHFEVRRDGQAVNPQEYL